MKDNQQLESAQEEMDLSLRLWQLIIDNEGKTFRTAGRGARPGAEFSYQVSHSTSKAGRHYGGQSVPGYGNELWIINANGVKREKSITRSTVELALRNALEEQEKTGCVSGPRKLGVPGVRSNLYAMFLRFGLIRSSDDTLRNEPEGT